MVTITLKKNNIEELEGILSEKICARLKKDSRYSNTFDVDLDELTDEEINNFLAFLKEKKARINVLKVQNYMDIKKNLDDVLINDLQNFTKALTEYIKATKNKWIFSFNGSEFLPYLVVNIIYCKARGRGDYFEEAFVAIYTVANTYKGYSERPFYFSNDDIKKKTITQILKSKNLYIENESLMENYFVQEERFLEEKSNFNKQYRGSVLFLVPGITNKYCKITGNFVNDEELNDAKYILRGTTTYWSKTKEEEIYDIPTHPYLYVYSLSTYENGYVYISYLDDYVYDDSLRDKLILPSTHRDLLDILSNDLTILSGDIIKGKSSGTTILCKGEPGTGKTLTAEVYSEITHKPLYKVNSGQLGIRSAEVEANLSDILKRAERWNAVMLLDEADTYIRKRGNDIEQNAIVAAFLRTLEYFDGLLFMTTNRVDDVDDAIESRCIAQILYEKPDKEDAERIWRVLAKEFDIDLSYPLIHELLERFPNISGRDIKELLRLTGRYCKAKNYKEINIYHFISCAQFRGIKILKN